MPPAEASFASPEARAFTLLELLIVIGVIALLSAMLLPSLWGAKLRARQAMCGSNLRALGTAAGFYEMDFNDYVPICWANIPPDRKNPWKSWRACLLPYTSGYEIFNCPAAIDKDTKTERFHSAEEILGQDNNGTANAGSYGVMYQYSLPSFREPNYSGIVDEGHPIWTQAFSTVPGKSWQDPYNSVYIADGCLTRGPITYPTESYKGHGTSAIIQPSDPFYFDPDPKAIPTRRFADRHIGTNCLFLGGYVRSYRTPELDAMKVGASDCVWDTY